MQKSAIYPQIICNRTVVQQKRHQIIKMSLPLWSKKVSGVKFPKELHNDSTSYFFKVVTADGKGSLERGVIFHEETKNFSDKNSPKS